MPPYLDLSKTHAHGDMLLAARKSPRINLRKSASALSDRDRGPQSSTSARFSFHHLMTSPPLSPSLPALVPRHGKPLPTHKPRRFLKGLFWLVGVMVIVHYAFSRLDSTSRIPTVGWSNNAGSEYEMVGDAELPDFPTPVVVVDKRGRAKWTVSIPPDTPFPLEPETYGEICMQNMEVAKHVETLHTHAHREHSGHYDYYHVDRNFMDVAEAETHGLLPGAKAKSTMREDLLIGEESGSLVQADVCEKSMTFVLETADAGLGKTLLMMWTAYGLAQKEGRAFFLDESRW